MLKTQTATEKFCERLSFVNSLIFRPPRPLLLSASSSSVLLPGVWCYPSNAQLQPKFILFFFHGNATRALELTNFAQHLANSFEALVVIPEYPGYCLEVSSPCSSVKLLTWSENYFKSFLVSYLSGGGDTSASGSKTTNCAMTRLLLSRIYLMGHSLGCAPASYLTSRSQYATALGGLVLLSPWTSLKEVGSYVWRNKWILKNLVLPFLNERLDLRFYLEKVQIPTMFVGCEQDDFMPLEMCRDLANISTSIPTNMKFLKVVLQADHIFPWSRYPEPFVDILTEFLVTTIRWRESKRLQFVETRSKISLEFKTQKQTTTTKQGTNGYRLGLECGNAQISVLDPFIKSTIQNSEYRQDLNTLTKVLPSIEILLFLAQNQREIEKEEKSNNSNRLNKIVENTMDIAERTWFQDWKTKDAQEDFHWSCFVFSCLVLLVASIVSLVVTYFKSAARQQPQQQPQQQEFAEFSKI